MYCHYDRYWPLVVHEFSGLQTLAEHEESLEVWGQCFLRNEPFVIFRIFRDEDALIHPVGAGKMTKNWLQTGAAASIKNSVTAMVNIVPENAYERMKHMSVSAVFGVPGGIFRSIDDAVEWCRANVDGTGISSPDFALTKLEAFLTEIKQADKAI